MNWLKRHWVTVLLSAVLVTGLGLMLYPTISEWWNSTRSSRAVLSYVETVSEMDEETALRYLQEAEDYNARLPEQADRWQMSEEELAEYAGLLDFTGTGVMGYLTIPKIDVQLPVYHGTDENVLQRALGHLEGSSLPVGGTGTHSVISGHRGLPGVRLLTDLDRIVEGDIFSITVLTRTVTYEVDQITVVLPENMDDLEIDPAQDYVTLVTCTPYGINSHRLLVRGHRTENPEGPAAATSDALQIPSRQVIPVTVLPAALLLILIGLLLPDRKVRLGTMAEVREAMGFRSEETDEQS